MRSGCSMASQKSRAATKPYQQVYPEITGRLCAVYPLGLNISIVQLTGEHLAEHFGKVSGPSPRG